MGFLSLAPVFVMARWLLASLWGCWGCGGELLVAGGWIRRMCRSSRRFGGLELGLRLGVGGSGCLHRRRRVEVPVLRSIELGDGPRPMFFSPRWSGVFLRLSKPLCDGVSLDLGAVALSFLRRRWTVAASGVVPGLLSLLAFGDVERKVQKSYWEEHSRDLTVESMMLDSRAKDLDKEERPEVLAILPSYAGKTVLELGAGIGRFTGELAKDAGHVFALDFIDSVIKKNEEINGHIYKNITFMCADVTSPELKIEDNSIDLVFSNWLLMYLNDEEVEKLIGRIVKWLKPGGHIFIRESCFHQSGDSKRKVNPTHYREPRFYTKVFKECHSYDQEGNSFELSLVTSKCIGAYVKSKKNQNQICWLWEKVKSTDDKGFQRFLDNVQYKSTGILRYERVFGEGYVSTGGFETTKEFVDMLDLKPGQKVLDVGCGIGGGDFYMAETYDVHVLGIDLSINMISFAIERAIGRSCSVEFEVADCTTKEYPENTFDVIYSRDTILHIQDKPALFRKFFKWLKPGGKVLISDYCRSPGTPSEEFAAYIKQRGYDLHDVKTYGKMLEDAGFHDVVAEDRTDQFLSVLERELGETEKNKEAFLADFTQEDYDDIVNGWSAKLKRSSAGEQKWGLFIATK